MHGLRKTPGARVKWFALNHHCYAEQALLLE
jgi:hypothetical protein